jgi:hypothetical protein
MRFEIDQHPHKEITVAICPVISFGIQAAH